MENRTQQIQKINQWAIDNPSRIFDEDFKEQRQYLTKDTWNNIYSKLNIRVGDKNWKKLPQHLQQRIFNEGINTAQNKAGDTIYNISKGIASVVNPKTGLILAGADLLGANVIKGITNETKKQASINAALEAIPYGINKTIPIVKQVIKHPKESWNTTKDTYRFIKGRIKHPFYKHYYHGSPVKFDIRNAWTGTADDMGLHMSRNRDIAKKMAGQKGIIYDFYAPKSKLEVMDLGYNDINLFNNNYLVHSIKKGNGYYNGSKYSKKHNAALKKYANATFEINSENPLFYKINVNQDSYIPIRDINYPNMPKKLRDAFDNIIKTRNLELSNFEEGRAFLKDPDNPYLKTSMVNEILQKANIQGSKVLSDNGHKVLSYWNINPDEGIDKCYFLTDPSKIQLLPKPIKITNWKDLTAFGGVTGFNLYNYINHNE